MFKDNKYTRIYYQIITRAQTRLLEGYYEKHHIIPRSLGGSDDSINLVNLTSKEHYICHALLVKMVISKQHLYKMLSAYNMMHLDRYKNRYTSQLYQYHKHQFYELKSKMQKGKKRSLESRQKQSKTTKGKPWSKVRRTMKISKPTAIPILVYNKTNGAFVGEWESISLCAKELNLDTAAIWKILVKWESKAPDGTVHPYKTHKGYSFKYKEP